MHVEIRNYTKEYKHKVIFKNINLSIKQGEMIALMGVSGSGKTTLLNTIGLIEDIKEGEYYFLNQKISTKKQKTTLIRKEISYLFQNYALVDSISVEDNLLMALQYVKKDKKTKTRLIKEALSRVGLAHYEKYLVYELSGGEQQRVAMARSILKPSSIILADEPTGSLDSGNALILMNLLKEINEEGKTIIIASHDELVARNCSRIIKL
ncbi:MAG: ATP-binding cassette domain-containing protein [Bacilli bacterium]